MKNCILAKAGAFILTVVSLVCLTATAVFAMPQEAAEATPQDVTVKILEIKTDNRLIGINGQFLNKDENGNYYPSGEDAGLPSGTAVIEASWNSNQNVNEYEVYATATTTGGEKRTVIGGNTIVSGGQGAPLSNLFSVADGRSSHVFYVPILGNEDRDNIIAAAEKLVRFKVTGQGGSIGLDFVTSLIEKVKGMVAGSFGNEGQYPGVTVKMTDENIESYKKLSSDGTSKLVNVLNGAIERLNAVLKENPTTPAEAIKLNDAEKNALADIVSGDLGTGWAPACGVSDGDQLTVQLTALVNVQNSWFESDLSNPVTVDVLVENVGKVFGKPCEHPENERKYTKIDDSNHSVSCGICGYDFPVEAHDFPENDAQKKFDGSNHWVECSKCGAKKNEAKHSINYTYDDNQHYAKCSVCNYQSDAEAHDVKYEHDGERHYKVCGVCGWKGTPEKHAMVKQSETDGITHYACVCGYTKDVRLTDLSKAEISGLDKDRAYTEEQAKNFSLTENGKPVDKDSYTVTVVEGPDNTLKITFEPVEEKSKNTFEISVKKMTDDLCPQTGKPHEYGEWEADASMHRRTCKNCGYRDEKGHEWGEYKTYADEHSQICTVCGAESEKTAHTLTNVRTLLKPTCTENGSITADCAICGKKDMIFSAGINEEVGKFPVLKDYLALGHDFSGPVTYFLGPKVCSSESEGNHAATCTRCGMHDDANASPHSWSGLHTVSNGTCEDPNDPVVQEAVCACGASLRLENMRHHDPVPDTSQDVQPTCTESGKRNGHRCRICGVFYDYEFVEALGHDFVLDDELAVSCEKDGYKHYTCSRCGEEKTETLEKLSPNGQHKWVKNVKTQPTCLTSGTYDGEICEYCGKKQEINGGDDEIPALGHDIESSVHTIGGTKNKVSKSGTPMDITVYEAVYVCRRCNHGLGVEYWTVATASNIPKYDIVSGKNAEITSLENGLHIDGNMANDGGVYFNGQVLKELKDVVDFNEKKYEFKKVAANSFIIEFSDDFLAATEDGTYEVIVINGDEYWPMTVTVKDHKLTELTDSAVPASKEVDDAGYEAIFADLEARGAKSRGRFAVGVDWDDAYGGGNAGLVIIIAVAAVLLCAGAAAAVVILKKRNAKKA